MTLKSRNIDVVKKPILISHDGEKNKIEEVEKYAKLLFESIEPSKIRLKNKKIVMKIKNEDNLFSGNNLYSIARNIKRCINIYKFNYFVFELDLTSIKLFADKNTYIFLDLFIFHLLYNCKKCKLNIYYDFKNNNSVANGFSNTVLYRMSQKKSEINREIFLSEYTKGLYIDESSYRKLLIPDDFREDTIVSIIFGDICAFFKNLTMIYGLSELDWFEDIGEVLSETVCNAKFHNKGLYLLDIDCCLLKDKEDKDYIAVNISIVNLGENLIYSKIQRNVKDKVYQNDDEIFSKVYSAYENHKLLFDEEYNENMFFIITAFQNRVTTKHERSGCNGTGLTCLIQNIINRTVDDLSYVLSGSEVLRFGNKILNISKDGFIGFNYVNDYINYPPTKEFLSDCKLFIPGTVFQLHLVKENIL